MSLESTPSEQQALLGKVIVVTGAGRGIGREIACLAARHGAAVVVNDVGGSTSGEGVDGGPAHEVVELIRAAGGDAVANLADVSNPEAAESIIEAAIQNFGRIDSVVNNAGILRDAIFHKMSVADFDAVIRVNLSGSFYVARAAARYFREQKSGAYVHFTSASGLIGNYAQANYSASKLGIVGLSKSIALDMERFNVRSNCIVPFAWSRLIGTLPDSTPAERERLERFKSMSADKIAPAVVFLASDLAAEVSGQVLAVRRNELFLMSQARPLRSIHRAEGWTPHSLAEQALPAIRSDFYPLDRSADVFSWDPI